MGNGWVRYGNSTDKRIAGLCEQCERARDLTRSRFYNACFCTLYEALIAYPKDSCRWYTDGNKVQEQENGC